MPNKSCLVIIASSWSSDLNFKFTASNLNLLLVFDTAMSQDIPSRPRLYLIQRASQDISLQDLACISTTYHLSAHSRVWVHFFSFLIYHNASPLATQFQSFFWLPIDIANDLLLVFDTATAQDITFIWYSELDLFILCRTHLWPRHILDFRALFRRPPTSPPLVACIRYSDTVCINIACVWYSKFDTVPLLLVYDTVTSISWSSSSQPSAF